MILVKSTSLKYNLHTVTSFQSTSFGKYIQTCKYHFSQDIEDSHHLQNLLWGILLSINYPHFEPIQSMSCLQINKIKPYVVFCIWFFHIWFFFVDSSILLNESGVHFLLLLFIDYIHSLSISLSIHQVMAFEVFPGFGS